MGQSKGYVDVPLTPRQMQPPAQNAPAGGDTFEDTTLPTPERGWMDELVDFGRGLWRNVNPITAVTGAADAAAHPVRTVQNIGAAQGALAAKAEDAFKKGDYITGSRHLVNYLIPLLGPALDASSDKMMEGKIAEGAGEAVGLGAAVVAPQIVKGAAPVVRRGLNTIADVADAKATANTVDTMVPKIGPNKRKFGVDAERVAPTVARDTTAVTRGGMLDQAAAKLDDANAALEAAYDAVPIRRTYATQPIKDGLKAAIRTLSVEGTKGTIEPATRAARMSALKQALQEVENLGGVTNLPNLRKLRQSWDEGAKAVFTPDIAADAFNLKNAGHGWADARTVLADYLGTKHPELKPLNAEVSLWVKARDVMQAAEDIERVRPTVGRSIMARGLGAATGAAGGGPVGAAVGAMVGPVIERVLANVQPAMRMIAARHLADLADALRSGNQARAAKLVKTLETIVPASAAANAAREGTVVPMPKAAEAPAERRQ